MKNKETIHLILLTFFLGLYLCQKISAQTPVPMAMQAGLSYTENFADIANWTDNFASGTGANRWKSVAINATGTIPDGVRTTVSTAAFITSGASGGVQRGGLAAIFSYPANPIETIVLLSTGTTNNTNSCAMELYLDFTGVDAGNFSFDWESIYSTGANRPSSLSVYYSTNGTTFTELTQISNVTTATSGNVNVALPAAFNGAATARLRFYEWNGSTGGSTGSRPKFAIDNVTATASIPLPISLREFMAFSNKKDVLLSFSTASERNNSHFEIERSADGQTFTQIGRVTGANNSDAIKNYAFTDGVPARGLNYYRLKQVDFDGKFVYSLIRTVTFGKTGNVSLFPAPTIETLHLQLEETFATDAQWQIMDMAGRVMSTGTLAGEQQTFQIPVNTLVAGAYLLRIVADQQVLTQQFSKQ